MTMRHVADVTHTIEVDLPATPATAGVARSAVCAVAREHGAHALDLERIALAVSEAVTNSILHAYGASAAGTVRVWAAACAGELSVLIADEGCGLGAAGPSGGLGLGVPIMRHSCDALTMSRRAAGGTLVEMRFNLCERELDARSEGAAAHSGRLTPVLCAA